METGEVKRYYEWIQTSRIGKVEVYLADDEKTVYFESGRMVPKEIFDHQLKQIEEDIYLMKARNEQAQVTVNPVDQFNEWEKMLGNDTPSISESKPQQPTIVVEQNPIKIILDKQRKKEVVVIPIDFSLEIPNKKVLSLLDVMFEREEVIEEIIKSATEAVNTQQIIEQIRESVTNRVNSYFDDMEKDDD